MRGVVARGHLDAAVETLVADGEVVHGARRLPDVHDRAAGGKQAVDDGNFESGAVRPRITPDADDGVRDLVALLQLAAERASDEVARVFRDLLVGFSADVVRAKNPAVESRWRGD